MKEFFRKFSVWFIPAAIFLILGGIFAIWFGLRQVITVVIDDEPLQVQTTALTTERMLQAAGIKLDSADRILTFSEGFTWDCPIIQVIRAKPVKIITSKGEIDLKTTERIPANLAREAGIDMFPKDRILWNGRVLDPHEPLRNNDALVLQFDSARAINLTIDGKAQVFYTDQPTLGAALEEEGFELGGKDWISEDLSSPVIDPLTVEIRRARPVTVRMGERSFDGWTAAFTVGEALEDIGMSLQNLDTSIPSEEELLPEDGVVRVIRGREALMIATEEVPFQTEYQEDPNTLLDQTSIIQPGQPGIFAVRDRLYFEDGEEVWRFSEDTWQASEPQTALVGYGSRVELQTAQVQGETLEYFRKVTVWTTSYKPCDYAGNCYYGTSSGLPVEKGVIAVSYNWYLSFNGQRVYVTDYGYGVIADVCGGCVGMSVPWIDLGYSEEQYQALHLPNAYRTMYFLAPIPGFVPVFLP